MKKKLKIISKLLWVIFLWTIAAFVVRDNVLGLSNLWDSIIDVIVVGCACLASMQTVFDIINMV